MNRYLDTRADPGFEVRGGVNWFGKNLGGKKNGEGAVGVWGWCVCVGVCVFGCYSKKILIPPYKILHWNNLIWKNFRGGGGGHTPGAPPSKSALGICLTTLQSEDTHTYRAWHHSITTGLDIKNCPIAQDRWKYVYRPVDKLYHFSSGTGGNWEAQA